MVVHLYGLPVDMDEITMIAKENKLFLIEDKENKNANKLVKFFPDQKIKLYNEITSDSENNNTVGLWCKKEDKIIIWKIFSFSVERLTGSMPL